MTRIKRIAMTAAAAAVMSLGAHGVASAGEPGDQILGGNENSTEFRTDRCNGSAVFISQGSPDNPGLLQAITTGVEDGCLTFSRIVYSDPNRAIVDTGFTNAGFSVSERQATAGGNGIRCFSEHQLIRNNGSYYTIRLTNDNAPPECGPAFA